MNQVIKFRILLDQINKYLKITIKIIILIKFTNVMIEKIEITSNSKYCYCYQK